jgi:hypothetical protein
MKIDPDPLVRGMDPRIRIHTKMSWIRNTVLGPFYARVDYDLTLCPLQHMYHCATPRIELDPMPESTLAPQSGT